MHIERLTFIFNEREHDEYEHDVFLLHTYNVAHDNGYK